MGQRRAKQTCPVCLETLVLQKGRLHDDALSCRNGHFVCHRCIARMLMPTRRLLVADSGFAYTCPMCRAMSRLNHLQAFALLKGSIRAVKDAFANDWFMEAWLLHEPAERYE